MVTNREGQRIPTVVFHARKEGQWQDITTDDIFLGKSIIVFSLPGAFTPTCSSSHVPRYNELVSVFKANGIDDVVCVSVNDAFVMEAWQHEQHADQIIFVPDGNGEFTEAMGMLVDKKALGFGQRSWRYSMLVKDGVIEKMYIEPEVPGDPYQVSDADTMLRYINAQAKAPDAIALFARKGCPHCIRAKQLLQAHNLAYEVIELSDAVTMRAVRAVSGGITVPQVFINGQLIGGADQLEQYLQKEKAA